MKPWLVFDVDDVLYDFVKSLYTISKIKGTLRNKDEHYSEWKTYNHLDFINFDTQEDFRSYMVENGVLETSYTIDGAREFMNWAKENFSLGFITARGFHFDAEKVTQNFLRNNLDIEPDKIIISGLYGDKKITHLNKFQDAPVVFFMDDNTHHVKDFQNNGVLSLVYKQKWNDGVDTDLQRVDSFNDVKSLIQQKLLKEKSTYFKFK